MDPINAGVELHTDPKDRKITADSIERSMKELRLDLNPSQTALVREFEEIKVGLIAQIRRDFADNGLDTQKRVNEVSRVFKEFYPKVLNALKVKDSRSTDDTVETVPSNERITTMESSPRTGTEYLIYESKPYVEETPTAHPAWMSHPAGKDRAKAFARAMGSVRR